MKIGIVFITAIILVSSTGLLFADSGREKIKFIYRKYQKFDFEDIIIEGETGAPGDLSITPRFQKKFANNLPYRQNFNAEIKKAIERIR